MSASSGSAGETDPICGMSVDPRNALSATRDGRRYYFCAPSCRDRFEGRLPSGGGAGAAGDGMAAPQGSGAWTCPMHPEIVREGPGACPICGMALEPRFPTSADTPENPELRDMTRRFAVSAALTIPIFFLSMADMITSLGRLESREWIEAALATPVVLWGGFPFFVRAARSVRNRSWNMFTLIGIGVGVAYLFSLAATAFPGLFPDSFRDHSGRIGVYFESAAVVVTLVLLGQVLELHARGRTGNAIRKLLALAPASARRVREDGADEDVPLSDVRVGDRLRVRPGERVPVDGVVLTGETAIDESMVTGEAIPVARAAGSRVIGATVNGAGTFVMRAERVGSATVLSQMARMVGEAQRSRAPIQRLADVVSSYFVPAVLAASAITFAVWAFAGPAPRMAHAVINAVAVLIIACPCALGLATPMSILVASGKGASAGVLFRDAEAIETLRRVDTLVVDKTGTLTEGRPRVTSVIAAAGIGESELLTVCAGLERGSEHPVASAVLRAAADRGIAVPEASGFRSVTGKGVLGRIGRREAAVGNRALLAELGVDPGPLSSKADELEARGATVLFAVVDGDAAGIIGVEDPIKPTTVEALSEIRRLGVRVVMVTGDHRATAQSVARAAGIDDVRAEMLPEQKVEAVRRLQGEGRVVAVAGDGVNDGPALARADVGIAMGTGTDLAMESAGVTLVRGDLRGILQARRLSEATVRNIRQNLVFAFGYNALGVPLAAGVLYPFWGVLLSPMVAAAAMSLSSVSVIGNALRLNRLRL